MYKTTLQNSPLIEVNSKTGKKFQYATDGSLANPLEATFAAINGCAGVYAIKACKQLGISPAGIEIETTPKNRSEEAFNVFGVNSVLTYVVFPPHFTNEQKTVILKSISECAVKEVIKNGAKFNFFIESN